MLNAQNLLLSCDRIDHLACALLQAVERVDLDDFLRQRNDIATDLKHQLMEDLRSVGLKLLATGDAATRAQVRVCFDELDGFDLAWIGYLTEWSDEAITADGQLFLSESRSILTAMRAWIKHWTGLLCSLGLKDGVIRLRALG
jgi:hypothetical protein